MRLTRAASSKNKHQNKRTNDTECETDITSTGAPQKRKQHKANPAQPPAAEENNTTPTDSNQNSTGPRESDSEPPPEESIEDLASMGQKDVVLFESTVNINNFLKMGRPWPVQRIQGVIDARGNDQETSHIPPEILAEARLAKQCYEKTKWMLAAIGKVKHDVLEKELFMAYGVDSLRLKMPNGRKAENSGNIMALRNAEATRIWGNYNAKERRVFHKDYFFALAGVPDLDNPEDNDSPATIPLLTNEEEEIYRPLYEKLVDHEKVMQEQGVQHLEKNLNKKSLKCVRKVGKMLARDGARLKFKYILMASSAHPPNSKTGAGWTRRFTTVPSVTRWADREIGLGPVFATVAQGQSMIKAISEANKKTQKKQNSSQPQPSDVLKTELASLLNKQLVDTLGYNPTRGKQFPLTGDPVAGLLKRKIPVQIIQEPGSKLSSEDLKVGHKAMHKVHRQEWMDDLTTNHFRLELLEGHEKEDNTSKPEQKTKSIKIPNGKGKRGKKVKSQEFVDEEEEAEEEVVDDEDEDEDEDENVEDDDGH
ncbi:uncharacterized protein MELLADRAFT_96323 [Melampsora larici-populina 98AG31]|uniref:Uncharacterized protein n=1 Tax=Melampsora larici-populina (strain 98AG31 / pathotype 3-4-7) TaxID=747676 RepID=F4RED1_MELLP|nr:uncharacterized protein MELLADRAFT_96323 [Melampsora larici-populina 98AG31]EGG09071.1 hypothetical protein MELLADRAFT_96323 [Melampsora larici-populina 98AG31]